MPRLFAISDVHLSEFNPDKAMDIFGPRWEGHAERLKTAWRDTVEDGDTVLIAGDISWAMRLSDAAMDLELLHSLPGRKILLRGNHDYWWQSYSKVLAALPPSVFAIQNNAVDLGFCAVCGTRGWLIPKGAAFSEKDDRRIYERELQRFRLSLEALPNDKPAVAMLHYPPFTESGEGSGFTELIREYPKVKLVVYGHLHNKVEGGCPAITRDGVRYVLSSADYLNFTPALLLTEKPQQDV